MVKFYNLLWNKSLAGGSLAGQVTFNLNNNNRTFNIKSVNWDYRLEDTTNNLIVPVFNNTQFETSLRLYQLNSAPIGLGFENFSDGSGIISNGLGFDLYKPSNIKFEGIQVLNSLFITLAYHNLSAANTIILLSSLCIETEDVIMNR